MIHELKTWSVPFEAVIGGNKTFEVRRHDRPFRVGDTLRLREYDPVSRSYRGRACDVDVTYIIEGDQFGIAPGYCVMIIRRKGTET